MEFQNSLLIYENGEMAEEYTEYERSPNTEQSIPMTYLSSFSELSMWKSRVKTWRQNTEWL